MVSNQAVKILLVGMTGAGKSTAGNLLVGRQNCFEANDSDKSVTQRAQTQSGSGIIVTDIPGYGDLNMDEQTWLGKFSEISDERFDYIFYVANGNRLLDTEAIYFALLQGSFRNGLPCENVIVASRHCKQKKIQNKMDSYSERLWWTSCGSTSYSTKYLWIPDVDEDDDSDDFKENSNDLCKAFHNVIKYSYVSQVRLRSLDKWSDRNASFREAQKLVEKSKNEIVNSKWQEYKVKISSGNNGSICTLI